MNLFEGINFLAVLVSAIIYYFIGFIWYTLLFGEIWRKETGVTVNGPAKPRPGALIGQFISTFLYTLGIAIILRFYGTYSIISGILVSAVVTLFIVIPINTGNLFFTGRKKLFLLDVCERATGSLLTGIILGLWH
jgi:hypothetical protein